MRYLFAIIAVVIVVSGISWKTVFPPEKEVKEAALVINDRIVSRQEYERSRLAAMKYSDDEAGVLDNIITKELLIQFAKSRGLDKEDAFTTSIKNYYEQTLIKMLMERQYAAMQAVVSEEEVQQYRLRLGQKVYLSVFNKKSMETSGGELAEPAGVLAELFENLPENVALAVFNLREGERSAQLKSPNGYTVYRLDRVEDDPAAAAVLSKEEIVSTIRNYKLQRQIDDWISSLHEKARIEVLVK